MGGDSNLRTLPGQKCGCVSGRLSGHFSDYPLRRYGAGKTEGLVLISAPMSAGRTQCPSDHTGRGRTRGFYPSLLGAPARDPEGQRQGLFDGLYSHPTRQGLTGRVHLPVSYPGYATTFQN